MQIHKILFSTYGRKITKAFGDFIHKLVKPLFHLWWRVHQIKEAFGDFIHKLVKSFSHLWWRGHQTREAFGDFIHKLVKSLMFLLVNTYNWFVFTFHARLLWYYCWNHIKYKNGHPWTSWLLHPTHYVFFFIALK
jgi:hypothetical protein